MTTLWLPLLLSAPSPSLRWLVLRDLLKRPDDDPELLELAALRVTDPLIKDLLQAQTGAGYWPGFGLSGRKGALQGTSQALIRLGTLGFGPEFPAVQRGADFLFSQQNSDGSWPLSSSLERDRKYSNYDMIPLQTAMPLRGLAVAGYASDPRAEQAFEWLLAQRLVDGCWPTCTSSGTYGRVAGYRRLPHSRWGCRSNTTGALLCLAFHRQRRTSPEAQRALDHLLARESRDRHALGFEVARIVGMEKARGLFTYFARFDMALLLELCWRIGASMRDGRVASLLTYIQSQQGPYGLWEYLPRPQVTHWLTFMLLRSLSRVDQESEWLSLEPRTPFQPYARRDPRY
jgi:hypothetical protein